MDKISISSKRIYTVHLSEEGNITNLKHCPLTDFLVHQEDEFEWVYAASEVIDDILDLHKGQSLFFQPNRDNKLSKGIITRIK